MLNNKQNLGIVCFFNHFDFFPFNFDSKIFDISFYLFKTINLYIIYTLKMLINCVVFHIIIIKDVNYPN